MEVLIKILGLPYWKFQSVSLSLPTVKLFKEYSPQLLTVMRAKLVLEQSNLSLLLLIKPLVKTQLTMILTVCPGSGIGGINHSVVQKYWSWVLFLRALCNTLRSNVSNVDWTALQPVATSFHVQRVTQSVLITSEDLIQSSIFVFLCYAWLFWASHLLYELWSFCSCLNSVVNLMKMKMHTWEELRFASGLRRVVSEKKL